MIILGQRSSRINFNSTTSQWILSDARSEVTAMSRATKLSYLLGKHEWTISSDDYHCGEGKPYTAILKLTGCRDGEFTCSDGQCISMQQRCDQIIHCRDESDEDSCKLIVFKADM